MKWSGSCTQREKQSLHGFYRGSATFFFGARALGGIGSRSQVLLFKDCFKNIRDSTTYGSIAIKMKT